MKKIIFLLLTFLSVSRVLFPQTNNSSNIDQNEVSKYFKLILKVAKVQVSAINSCVKLEVGQSKNAYVLVDRIKYVEFANVGKEINQLLSNKGHYFNFTKEIKVKDMGLDALLSQIKKKDYFEDQLIDKSKIISGEITNSISNLNENISNNSSSANQNSFIYILRDFKVDYKNDIADYRIVFSVVDVKKEKVLCNVNTNIDLKKGVILFGKVKGRLKVVPKYVEKVVEVERPPKPKEDHLFSIMTYFSGNVLDTGFYNIFEYLHGKGKIYNFGVALQYDKYIYDSLYIGFEIIGGYLYTDISNNPLFAKNFVRRLVIGANMRPTYVLNISERYSIDFLLGLRLGYFRLLETNNVMYGGFLGFRFGYFKIEAAYPFPFISVGVIF